MSYGDYPYGNEMLRLPVNYKGIILSDNPKINSPNITTYNAQPKNEILYWYRWVMGHHISFIGWLLISKYLYECTNENCDIDKDIKIERCKKLFSLLNCMYIYTASVTNDTYEMVIRKFMKLYCDGFSATWAHDYREFKKIIKKFSKNSYCSLYSEDIKHLYNDGILIHIAIANKLVNKGKSLLKDLNFKYEELTIKNNSEIYDNFFLVKRVKSISEKHLICDLNRRLVAIQGDLKVNDLFNKCDKEAYFLTTNGLVLKYIDNITNIISDNIRYE